MSQSSTSWNGDIGVRYERLAAEYAKLRSQATVLKKGVLDERAKNEKLTEELKAADTVTRKLRSENESLTFRNEQLLKRVHNVQASLEEAQCNKGGNKKEKKKERERQLETSLAILEEELKNKLITNEILTNKVEELEKVQDILTLELKELKEKMSNMDKNGLTPRPIKSTVANGTSSLSHPPQSSSPISYPSPSLSSSSLNLHSSPTIISSSPSDSLLWNIADSARSLISGMSTLLSLLEQRLRIYPYDASLERLPSHIDELSSCLGEASNHFSSAFDAVNGVFEQPADMWESTTPLAITSFTHAIDYAQSNLPEKLIALSQEESRCTWSDSRLESLNERWRVSLSSLLSSFSSFPSFFNESIHSSSSSSSHIKNLYTLFTALHAAIKSTQESYSARWLVETRLPVQTKKGKCVGTATRDCLLKMMGESTKIQTRMSLAIKDLEEKMEREKENEKENEIINIVNKKITEDEQSEEEETIDKNTLSIIDSHSISRKESIISGISERNEEKKKKIDIDSARRQSELDCLHRRIHELEGEREKILLDLTLLKTKLSHIPSSSPSNDQSIDISDQIEIHYRNRLRERSKAVLQAQARGDYYSKECEILVRSARCLHEEKKRLEERLDGLNKEKLELFDELGTIRSGYECKLREMTEHIAQMNKEKEEKEKINISNNANTNKSSLTRRLTLFK